MAGFHQLGSYLKQKRSDSGYSQVELAEILGYSSSQFVSNWERGISAPPPESLQKLIKLLKLNKDTIIHFMLLDYKVELEQKLFKKSPKSARKSS